MPRKTTLAQPSPTHKCSVCNQSESRYRCPSCTIRYCSVACYKAHKATAHPVSSGDSDDGTTSVPDARPVERGVPDAGLSANDTTTETPSAVAGTPATAAPPPLRSLTTLSWPPEPDESIFTDPLKKEDPKPLRRDELLRIATSPDLRQLLLTTSLPLILSHIDALSTPSARSSVLSQCLSIDPASLAQPRQSGSDLLAQRDSPPPLDDLLRAVASQGQRGGNDLTDDEPMIDAGGERGGFWLGGGARSGIGGGAVQQGLEPVWVGEEEKRIMRIWAGIVCRAIDCETDSEAIGGGGGAAWGKGGLEWDL